MTISKVKQDTPYPSMAANNMRWRVMATSKNEAMMYLTDMRWDVWRSARGLRDRRCKKMQAMVRDQPGVSLKGGAKDASHVFSRFLVHFPVDRVDRWCAAMFNDPPDVLLTWCAERSNDRPNASLTWDAEMSNVSLTWGDLIFLSEFRISDITFDVYEDRCPLCQRWFFFVFFMIVKKKNMKKTGNKTIFRLPFKTFKEKHLGFNSRVYWSVVF